MAASWTSGPRHARFHQRYGERCSIATVPAASRDAWAASAKGTTSGTGPRAAPPHCQTSLSNLVLLCRRHHRAVHEEGYQVDREPDGELRFRRPEGVRVDARTATPGWCGERLDLGWAIDALHRLAG